MSFWRDQQYQGSVGDTLFGNGVLGMFGLFNKDRPLPQYANPNRPDYIPGYFPEAMDVHPYAQTLTSNILPDTRGIEGYRKEALRTGPSAWSGLARGQLAADENMARNQLASQGAAQSAAARSNLAMRGGLTGGAAERLATQSGRDQMMANQALAGQGISNRAKIAVQDEANRLKMLQGLPGMEIDQLRPAQWQAQTLLTAKGQDNANITAENARVNAWNQDAYAEAMRAIQAQRNADVTMATAPKDRGFLGNILGGIGLI